MEFSTKRLRDSDFIPPGLSSTNNAIFNISSGISNVENNGTTKSLQASRINVISVPISRNDDIIPNHAEQFDKTDMGLWAFQIPNNSFVFARNIKCNSSGSNRLHLISPVHLNYILHARYIHIMKAIDKYPTIPIDWSKVIDYCLDGWIPLGFIETSSQNKSKSGEVCVTIRKNFNGPIINYHGNRVTVGDHLYFLIKFIETDLKPLDLGMGMFLPHAGSRFPSNLPFTSTAIQGEFFRRGGDKYYQDKTILRRPMISIECYLNEHDNDDEFVLADYILKIWRGDENATWDPSGRMHDFIRYNTDDRNMDRKIIFEQFLDIMHLKINDLDVELADEFVLDNLDFVYIGVYTLFKIRILQVFLQQFSTINEKENLIEFYEWKLRRLNKIVEREHLSARKYLISDSMMSDDGYELNLNDDDIYGTWATNIMKHDSISIEGASFNATTNTWRFNDYYTFGIWISVLYYLLFRAVGNEELRDFVFSFAHKHDDYEGEYENLKKWIVVLVGNFYQFHGTLYGATLIKPRKSILRHYLARSSKSITQPSNVTRNMFKGTIVTFNTKKELELVNSVAMDKNMWQPARRAWDEREHHGTMIPQITAFHSKYQIETSAFIQSEHNDPCFENTFAFRVFRYGMCSDISHVVNNSENDKKDLVTYGDRQGYEIKIKTLQPTSLNIMSAVYI